MPPPRPTPRSEARRWGPSLAAALSLVGILLTRDAAEAAQLKSLQNGTVTLPDTQSSFAVVLPTAVDTTKAFLVFGTAENTSNPADGQITGQITTPTGVSFQRTGTTGAVTIKYYVAEFSSGVSVQRGTLDVSAGAIPYNVTLGPAVSLTKSFPLLSYRSTRGSSTARTSGNTSCGAW